MNITIDNLSSELGVSRSTIRKFIEDFDLKIGSVLDDELGLKDNFIKFAHENTDFLIKYQEDILAEKTPKEIAEKINQPENKVKDYLQKDYPNLYESAGFKTSISSYGVDRKLGGDYQFVYKYFDEETPLMQYDFIGYRDLFFYLVDAIEPFINPTQLENWGIARPAGIIIYGPPGSGKIFWAKKIAKMIGYQFIEAKDNYFSIIMENGKSKKFSEFLFGDFNKPKTLLFMEHFEGLVRTQTPENPMPNSLIKIKNTILQTLSHNLEKEILYIGSANQLTGIDEEITAPGRFDVVIPVFPPNVEERAEMILEHMKINLKPDAPLLQVLKANNADKLPFWMPTAQKMKLFSNTMLIDFTQALKKKIHSEYIRVNGKNVVISENIIMAALSEATAKLTPEYLNQCANFITELAQNNGSDFSLRIQNLLAEIDQYRAKEIPIRKIGFNVSDEEEEQQPQQDNEES